MAVWVGVAITWTLSHPSIRQSLGGLIKVALNWKILVPIVVILGYIGIVVWGMSNIGLWNRDLLKDTILWSLFSGLALALAGFKAQSDVLTWRSILKDQLKVIILLEFVVNTYTFELWVELLLIPTLGFIGLLDAVARLDQKHAQVATLSGFLQGVFGLAILGFALRRAFAEALPGAQNAAQELLLAPVLSLSLLPIVYLFFLVSAYEQLFLMLSIGPKIDSDAVWYAKRRLLWSLGIRPMVVREFLRQHRDTLRHAKTRSDIDKLLGWET